MTDVNLDTQATGYAEAEAEAPTDTTAAAAAAEKAQDPTPEPELWPELDPAALHGLAGEIVNAIDPHTEAQSGGGC